MKQIIGVSAFSLIALLSGTVDAQEGGWWGQEMAALPGLLGDMAAGAAGAVASDPNPAQSAAGAGDMAARDPARLSDDHWQITQDMVDLDGDGSVSVSELTGMLEGGKLRNPEAAGLIDMPEVVGATEPAGYEAVSLEQGLIDSPFSVLSARVEARFAGADQNGDGGVDLAELMQLRRAYMAAHGKDAAANKLRRQARRIMARIDRDGDQKITREELAASRANHFMSRLDTDRDGAISPAEWAVTLQ